MPNKFETISALAKRRGFIFQGSEIYGGLAGTWDYGPLGAELKRNIKNEFWKSVVQRRADVVGIDAAIIMSPKVWEASGHLDSFSDPLVECKKCHHRFRADTLETEKCPDCGGEFTEPKQFNLMVETYLGVVEGEKTKTYLRGEITQGVHVNFKNVLDSSRVKLPFGVAQVGKAFRNEITPGGLTFRSREFEQMELQFYVKPEDEASEKWFTYWQEERMNFYTTLGMKRENLRFMPHEKEKLAHYARMATDIEYNTSDPADDGAGWKEMEGIHHRGDFDVHQHQKASGIDMTYFDEETKERYLPFIIETSGGVDRATLFFLMDAYNEEEISSKGGSASGGKEGDTRTVLKLHPLLAPYKVAVFPLLANKPELTKKAESIFSDLKTNFMVAWDSRGNVGKRYRAQDEIGTPYCVTVDFETLESDTVTVRDRDTMEQIRIPISELKTYIAEKLK